MRSIVFSVGLSLLAATASAADPKGSADSVRKDIQNTFGFVPDFLRKVPDHAIAGAWEEMRGIEMNPLTALPAKYKELIALAVAAQAPCESSVYRHTQLAKLHGATDAEIAESVMLGAVSRHWSIFVNGLRQDESKFRADLTKMVAGVKKGGASTVEVVDDKTALADIQLRFGTIPEFLRQFPTEGRVGAWKERRDLILATDTAIPPKYKVLISLAVAAQVPCAQCMIADTAFASVTAVSEREMREAVAIASLVRHWSTWLTGMQIDPAGHRRDVDRIVRGLKRGVPVATKSPSPPAVPVATKSPTPPAVPVATKSLSPPAQKPATLTQTPIPAPAPRPKAATELTSEKAPAPPPQRSVQQ